MTFSKPLLKTEVGKLPPTKVIPSPEEIAPEFWSAYTETPAYPKGQAANTFQWAQNYIGAAIDYMQTKHPDKENFLPREDINTADAFAHLNYVVHNELIPDKHKRAALAFLMHCWFYSVPPKFRNYNAKLITTQ